MFFFARGGLKGEAVTFGRGGSAMVFDECGTVVSVFFERHLLCTYCVCWTKIIAEKHLFVPLTITVQTVDSRGRILLPRSRRSIEADETVMVYTVGVRCLFRIVSSFRFKQIEGCIPHSENSTAEKRFWTQWLFFCKKMTTTEKYTVHSSVTVVQ